MENRSEIFVKPRSAIRRIKKLRGLAISEYLPIVAMVAVASFAIVALFGDVVQRQVGSLAQEISGGQGTPIAEGSTDASESDGDGSNNGRNNDGSVIDTVFRAGQGLFDGFKTQVGGLANMALHPIETAKNLGTLAKALITDPAGTLAAIEEEIGKEIQAVASGDPYEIGRVIGENLSPAMLLRVAGKLAKFGAATRKFDIKCSSFAAGTLVWTAGTRQAIEQLAAGQTVSSRDDRAYTDKPAQITKTLHRTANDYYLVTTETGDIIEVTGEHPFWVQGKGWLAAAELDQGTAVATLNGDTLIRAIEHINEPIKVFNLSVDDTPSYFVGESGLWVHNANKDCRLEGAKNTTSTTQGGNVATKSGRGTTDFLSNVTVKSHGKVVRRGTVDLRGTLGDIGSGKLKPRDTFQNREGLLPKKPAGYYQEFVHPTPGVKGAGSQRIARGQGGELYYTPDHYQSFVPLN